MHFCFLAIIKIGEWELPGTVEQSFSGVGICDILPLNWFVSVFLTNEYLLSNARNRIRSKVSFFSFYSQAPGNTQRVGFR